MDFTDLPAELRCITYGHLFADLVNPHELKSDLYRLPEDWPKNDFAALLALIQTSRLINSEALPYFEKHFLPSLTLHFDNVAALHKVAKALPQTPAYQDVRFVFTTRCKLLCRDFVRENDAIRTLLARNIAELWSHNWDGHQNFRGVSGTGKYHCGACGINLDVTKQGEAGSLLFSYWYGERENKEGLTLFMRGLWNGEEKKVRDRTWYSELSGRIKDLEWDGCQVEEVDVGEGVVIIKETDVEKLRRWAR